MCLLHTNSEQVPVGKGWLKLLFLPLLSRSLITADLPHTVSYICESLRLLSEGKIGG